MRNCLESASVTTLLSMTIFSEFMATKIFPVLSSSCPNVSAFSKLIYCLPVYGNIWGLANLYEIDRSSISFTKQHCRILQILQNKVLRIITQRGYDTPVCQLLEESGHLSIHQLTAYHTALAVFKVVKTGQPVYLAKRFGLGQEGNEEVRARRRPHDIRVDFNLSIARSGFIYRGAKLWNMIPINVRNAKSPHTFT